jgi:hypothetical protein
MGLPPGAACKVDHRAWSLTSFIISRFPDPSFARTSVAISIGTAGAASIPRGLGQPADKGERTTPAATGIAGGCTSSVVDVADCDVVDTTDPGDASGTPHPLKAAIVNHNTIAELPTLKRLLEKNISISINLEWLAREIHIYFGLETPCLVRIEPISCKGWSGKIDNYC